MQSISTNKSKQLIFEFPEKIYFHFLSAERFLFHFCISMHKINYHRKNLTTTAEATPRALPQAMKQFGQNLQHERGPDMTVTQCSPTLHEHRSLWLHRFAQLLQQKVQINYNGNYDQRVCYSWNKIMQIFLKMENERQHPTKRGEQKLPSCTLGRIWWPSLVTHELMDKNSEAKLGRLHETKASFPMMTKTSDTRVWYTWPTAKQKE